MAEFYIDIDMLAERNRRGEEVKDKVLCDLEKLEQDLEKARDGLSPHDYDEISGMVQNLRALSENILGVCEYDSYAVRKYTETCMKIEDMTEGIQL